MKTSHRLLNTVAAVSAALLTQTGLPSPVAHATAAHATAAADSIVVTPARTLFDVRLSPGQSETATATLYNDSDHPQHVRLSALVDTAAYPADVLEHLLFASARTPDCLASGSLAASSPLVTAVGVDHGVLAPRETATVCLTVALAETAKPSASVVVAADFAFDAIRGPGPGSPASPGYPAGDAERPSLGIGGGALAATGSDPVATVLAAALAALALLVAGVRLAIRRRRPAAEPAQTDSAPTDSAQTNPRPKGATP